jgi:hypothetical protein
MNRTCFLNVGIGQWYVHGSDRLAASLIKHGFKGDQLIWKDQWPGALPLDHSCVYNVKPDAFQHAINAGYKTIIWGDSSIYAVRPLDDFIEAINTKGYWIGQSGYNCAQVCGDAMLQYFGVSRDWAESVPDCATGIFGVNMDFPAPRRFIETWIQAAKDGAFRGSRHHDGQSSDPRFKFGRQDQAAASLILGSQGMTLDLFLNFAAFKWDADTGQTFRCEGM